MTYYFRTSRRAHRHLRQHGARKPRKCRRALRDPRVKLVRGDVRDVDLVRKATHGMDAVVHLAALRITACSADPREALEVMCDGSFNVVDAAHTNGVQKIVAARRRRFTAWRSTFPTAEQHHPYNNTTWYGACKVMLEGLLRSFYDMFDLPYVALRYFNVYGERMDIHGKYTEVLVRWMERIDAGEPPVILGDGLQSMDFVHVDDVARANVLALSSDVVDDVFNVASGTETTLARSGVGAARGSWGRICSRSYGPERHVNAVSRRLADTAKAERVLGFSARIGLEEGLTRLGGVVAGGSGKRWLRHDPYRETGDGRGRSRRARAGSSSAAG